MYTNENNLKNLEKELEQEGMKARKSILSDMNKKGYGAVIWGENLFGSTDYPLIENTEGKDVSLKGFRVISPDKIVAITGLPDGLDITGAKALTPGETDKLLGTVAHDQGFYDDGGSPEQWEIAADCYKVALETIESNGDAKRINSWW